jgi:hypothetical protein
MLHEPRAAPATQPGAAVFGDFGFATGTVRTTVVVRVFDEPTAYASAAVATTTATAETVTAGQGTRRLARGSG